MEIITYDPKKHKQIIRTLLVLLKQGKVVAYPTDTSYGLAADTENPKALQRLYRIKERQKKQPIHVVVPSVAFAKKIVEWNAGAAKLTKQFWPGPLTPVLKLKPKGLKFKTLTGGTKFLGIRFPNNKIALDLAKALGRPITTTGANPSGHLSGGTDSYSGKKVYEQFANQKYKPDAILDAGVLPQREPSTLVKIENDNWQIIRKGPIKEKQIKKALS